MNLCENVTNFVAFVNEDHAETAFPFGREYSLFALPFFIFIVKANN